MGDIQGATLPSAPAASPETPPPASSAEQRPQPGASSREVAAPILGPGDAVTLQEFFNLGSDGRPTGAVDEQIKDFAINDKPPLGKKPIDIENAKLAVEPVDPSILPVNTARDQYKQVLDERANNPVRFVQQKIADRIKLMSEPSSEEGKTRAELRGAAAKEIAIEEWKNLARLNRPLAEQQAERIPLLNQAIQEIDAEVAQAQPVSEELQEQNQVTQDQVPAESPQPETQAQQEKKDYTINMREARLVAAKSIEDKGFQGRYKAIQDLDPAQFDQATKDILIGVAVNEYYLHKAQTEIQNGELAEVIADDIPLYKQILLEKVYEAKKNGKPLDEEGIKDIAAQGLRDYHIIKNLEEQQQNTQAKEIIVNIAENFEKTRKEIEGLPPTQAKALTDAVPEIIKYMSDKDKKSIWELLAKILAAGGIIVSGEIMEVTGIK